jgi:hypothetical protein
MDDSPFREEGGHMKLHAADHSSADVWERLNSLDEDE